MKKKLFLIILASVLVLRYLSVRNECTKHYWKDLDKTLGFSLYFPRIVSVCVEDLYFEF